MKSLNELAKEVHAANEKWWIDLKTGQRITRNRGQLLMLVVTELAEAVEGIRKNLKDDKILHRSMEEVEMADAFIRLLDYCGGFEIEIGIGNMNWDTNQAMPITEDKAETILFIVSGILDLYEEKPRSEDESERGYGEGMSALIIFNSIIAYCKKFNLDLMGAYAEKMEYNRTRADHQHEARLKEHGKKF